MIKDTETEELEDSIDSSAPLNVLEEDFLLEAMNYFGIERVSVDEDNTVSDILCYPYDDPPRILVGRKWFGASQPERMKRLTHELIHIYGYDHGTTPRNHGYYSKPERDVLSLEVFRDIMDEGGTFDPRKFGMNRHSSKNRKNKNGG